MDNDQAIEQAIQAAGKTAPRVTPDSIKAVIASEHYFTASDGVVGVLAIDDANGKKPGDTVSVAVALDIPDPLELLTFCVLVLKNGFTVTGKSACASPENFDANIGRKIARDDAISQVWPLEGYLLKQHLYEAGQSLQQLEGAELLAHFNDLQRQYAAAGAEVANRGGAALSGRPAYQQRVVDEYTELNDKVNKLAAFLVTSTFAGLDDGEQSRLINQVAAMRSYADILAARILAFPTP